MDRSTPQFTRDWSFMCFHWSRTLLVPSTSLTWTVAWNLPTCHTLLFCSRLWKVSNDHVVILLKATFTEQFFPTLLLSASRHNQHFPSPQWVHHVKAAWQLLDLLLSPILTNFSFAQPFSCPWALFYPKLSNSLPPQRTMPPLRTRSKEPH